MARFFRTVSPQSLRSSLSSGRAYSLLGLSPAARTASFHLGKSRKREYLEISALAANSRIEGVWPSSLATVAMDFKTCCLLSIFEVESQCGRWRETGLNTRHYKVLSLKSGEDAGGPTRKRRELPLK